MGRRYLRSSPCGHIEEWRKIMGKILQGNDRGTPQPCCCRALPGKYFSAYTRIILSTLSFRVDFNPMKYYQVTIWGEIIVDVILVIK